MMRILIIDDEEINRNLLKELLAHEGYETILAQDGAEGIQAYLQHAPDLVITDIMMPGKDGYEVIKEICQHADKTRIVALAAAGDLALTDARAAGADATLEKPFHIRDLLATVRELLSS